MNNNKNKQVEELNKQAEEFNKQAEELLECLEANLEANTEDYKAIQREVNELQIQREKAMYVFFALGGIASIYTLMFVMKIVMAIIG